LKRLNTSYLDILYVHFWDWTTSTEEVMRSLDEVVRSGKVLHIGISDCSAWKVSAANELSKFHGWSPFIAYQGKYSLVCRDIENEIMPMCKEYNIGFIPWGSIGQGKLTGKHKKDSISSDTARKVQMTDLDYKIQDSVIKIAEELSVTPAQVAINWCLNKPQISSCLVGPRTYEQFADNMKSLDFCLSKEQMKTLDSVSEGSINKIFPFTFIGGNYKESQVLYWGSDPYIIE